MTEPEAEDLATRIVQTWRATPPADVWVEELLRLDAGACGTAFARLRREASKAPTIAEFLNVYRTINVTDGGNKQERKCAECDNSGWVYAPELVLGTGDAETRYSQVMPCKCTAGRQIELSDIWTRRTR